MTADILPFPSKKLVLTPEEQNKVMAYHIIQTALLLNGMALYLINDGLVEEGTKLAYMVDGIHEAGKKLAGL